MTVNYYRPQTIEEAVHLLTQENGIVLAGGVHLTPQKPNGTLIDLQSLSLDQIEIEGDKATVGAMCRLQQLVDAEELPAFIRQMAQKEEINTFRNAGTLGGLIALADWESELYALLLTCQATLKVERQDGTQEMALAHYAGGGFDAGILTHITFQTNGDFARERVARTPADKPIVAIVGRKANDVIHLAGCGLAATPINLQADDLASATPPADFRGSASYRLQMAQTLLQRVVDQLGG